MIKPENIVKYCDLKDAHINTSNLKPGEIPRECINCILDDILNTPKGITREGWVNLYKEGFMGLHCRLTGKKYIVNEEFLNTIR
jgi:hypothetical protein